jgi:predicted N-acetyltransferase YhbS
MNAYFRLVGHSDSAWHDRFFGFVASIFEDGRTFSPWGARGGWVDGYDVFAMVFDDQIVGTVGWQSMRYVINGKERSGYQLGAVATRADHRNRGLARLLMNKVLGELDAPDQPVILFANSSVVDFYPRFGFRRLVQSSFIGISMSIPRPHLRQVWTSQGQQTARGWPSIAPEPVLPARALPRATTIQPCYFI